MAELNKEISIVDYLKSIGQDSSYQARASLASQQGIEGYSGTAEQNIQLLNALRSAPTKAQAPVEEAQRLVDTGVIDADMLKNTSTPNLANVEPTIQSVIADAKTSADYTQAMVAGYIQKSEDLAKGLAGEGITSTGYQAMIDLSQQRPKLDIATTEKEAEERYGIPELQREYSASFAKLQALQNQSQALELERLAKKENLLSIPSSSSYRSAEEASIDRIYNLKQAKLSGDIMVESGYVQIAQNNLSEARNMVDKAINYYLMEFEYEKDKFDNLFSIYGSWIEALSQEEQNILTQARADLENKEKDEKERMMMLGELLLQYPSAGIDIKNDTIEQGLQKAGITAEEYERIEKANMELDRRIKEANLRLAELEAKKLEAALGAGTFTDKEREEYERFIHNQFAAAMEIAKRDDKTIYEAIKDLPLNAETRDAVVKYASDFSTFQVEEKAEALERLKTEPLTPKLVDELLSSGIEVEEMENALVDNYKKIELRKAMAKTERAENVYQSILNEIRKYKGRYNTDFKIIEETSGHIKIETTEPVRRTGQLTAPIISLGGAKKERFSIAKGNLFTHLGFVFDDIPIIDLMIERNPDLVSQSLIDQRRYEKMHEEDIAPPFSIED